MLFAVIFKDRPGHGHVRAAHLSAHVDWLEQNQACIPVGGSLRTEPSEVPIGGLWIADAPSREALDTLLKTDPFYLAGLRESYEILHWSKANDARKASI